MPDYDAFLLLSFGGPEGPDEVMPFLRNVLRGRNVPEARMLAVAEHYFARGGKSPINDLNRELASAISRELAAAGIDLPLYWGNRNWDPFLEDTLVQMTNDGIRRAICLVTSAYSSYSGCRQYLTDLESARENVPRAPEIDKIRPFFNHPGFVEANRKRLEATCATLTRLDPERCAVAFTAHSVPIAMADGSEYVAQLEETARLVAESAPELRWKLVYQSRSGPPSQPWLEPDISDHLRTLSSEGASDVIVAPIGFIADHMEVIHDLDTEARETAEGLGLRLHRAATAGCHPAFVRGIRELVEERLYDRPPTAIGSLPPRPHACPEDCCPAPKRPRSKPPA